GEAGQGAPAQRKHLGAAQGRHGRSSRQGRRGAGRRPLKGSDVGRGNGHGRGARGPGIVGADTGGLRAGAVGVPGGEGAIVQGVVAAADRALGVENIVAQRGGAGAGPVAGRAAAGARTAQVYGVVIRIERGTRVQVQAHYGGAAGAGRGCEVAHHVVGERGGA